MTNAEERSTDTVSDAEMQPRVFRQLVTAKMLSGPTYLRYGYKSDSDMEYSHARMSAAWRLVEEQELNNRLLECLIEQQDTIRKMIGMGLMK